MSNQLRESESLPPTDDRYRQILDAAPDAMLVIDARGEILFMNRQTTALFGYTTSELLGKTLETLLPERFRGNHGRHVARYFSAPALRTMGSGLELFGLRKDGTEVNIEVSLSPVRTGTSLLVSAAIRDISDRKQIEAQAKVNADRLSSAVESIDDPVAIFDASDRLVLSNRAYRDQFPGEVCGKLYSELIDGASALLRFTNEEEKAAFLALRLAERKDPKGMFDVRTLDGRSLRVTNRRTLDGGIVQTTWDLTDNVRYEEELQKARVAAEAGSEAKSEFLSSMSHELRTPLNAILGFAQLLERDKKEPLSIRHRDRVSHIVKGGEHLLRLIDDILDLSRIEAGGVSISTEPVDLALVLSELVATLGPMAARNGLALDLLPVEEGLPLVAADRTRLAQILMNFASNAIKYNRPSGTVTVKVSGPTAGMVRITVIDSGIGIPEDKQASLFQPFQRAGQETGPIEGTGIGLVITKRLAELMGGSVGFQSAQGDGSAFWLDVPVYVSHSRSSAPPSVNSHETLHLDDGPQRTIVYVEDNPANVAFMRDLLGNFEGLELITAPTAEMGLELIRKKLPELVLMDINLPGMSGLEALGILLTDPRTKSIPVIALTAAASDRDKQRGMQAGFYRYLTKPVRVDELLTALEPLLKTPASRS
jgi:PAS domain S-box-containing protein